MKDNNFAGMDGFIWWKGVVEDRNDPLFLGRLRVRILGHHNQDKQELPTEALPWAEVSLPLDNGNNSVGARIGDVCWGWFKDGELCQEPVVVGYIPGRNTRPADPTKGFNDPTPDEDLVKGKVARPPEMIPVEVPSTGSVETVGDPDNAGEDLLGPLRDPNKLPGSFTSFGELVSDFVKHGGKEYPFDINNDGVYDAQDAELLAFDANNDGIIDKTENKFVGHNDGQLPQVPISRYPLEHKLNEPSTSRLARGEKGDGKIEETIVNVKKSNTSTFEAGDYEPTMVGTDKTPSEVDPIVEPETPYDAVYPFNKAYESESGHVFETDDTPGFERLHWYHRAGTFREVHPDGTLVTKTKGEMFLLSEDHAALAATKDLKLTAGEKLCLKSSKETNIKAGERLNITAESGDLSIFVKNGNLNIKVSGGEKGQVTWVVDDSFALHVKGGDMKLLCDENITMLAHKNVKIAANESIILEAKESIFNNAAINISNTAIGGISNQSSAYIQNIAPSYNVLAPDIRLTGLVQFSLPIVAIPLFSLGSPATPQLPPTEPEVKEPEAPEKQNAAFSPKEGFILNEDSIISGSVTATDLFKPMSDSDGNAVTLSPTLGSPHALYEAIPTGILEEVTLQYKHKDGTIVSWQVKRPVHKKGRQIEAGRFSGNGNGGRDHYRYKRPGAAYGGPVIFSTGATEYLLVDAKYRHEAF